MAHKYFVDCIWRSSCARWALNYWFGCFGPYDRLWKFFLSYVLSPDNHKVKIADGSFTVVAGMGTIELSPRIMLKGILHVLNLSCNLLSISKITKDLQCVVNFTPSLCVFQKQHLGKKISNTRELYGLYYFENESSVSGHVRPLLRILPFPETKRSCFFIVG